MPNATGRTKYNFVKTVQALGLRLHQYDRRLHGARITANAANVLKAKIQSSGQERLALQVDPAMRFDELERVLDNSRFLGLCIKVVDAALVIENPRSVEQWQNDLIVVLGKSQPVAIAKLRELNKALATVNFNAVLKGVALEVIKSFKAETRDFADFDFVMGEICRLNDHELNQQVIDELLDIKTHDRVYVSVALDKLRKAFPNEIVYHKTTGDFYFNLARDQNAHLFKEAIEAYREVLRLTPEPKITQPVKQSRPQAGKKKGKVARGRGKKAKVKKKAKQNGLVARIKEAEKLRTKQTQAQIAALTTEVNATWALVDNLNVEGMCDLAHKIRILGAERFESIIKLSKDSPKKRLAKFDNLRDLCEAAELDKMSDYFQALGDELVGDIFENIARGRSFSSDPKVSSMAFESETKASNSVIGGFKNPQMVSYQRPESFVVAEELILSDSIEAIDQKLMMKIFEASQRKEHPHHNPATFIMGHMVWAHKQKADALFSRYSKATEAGTEQDLGLLEQAEAHLRTALHFFDFSAIRSNIGAVVTMQGVHHHKRDNIKSARERFEAALEVNPGNPMALEKLARLANAEAKFQEAMGFSRLILEKAESAEGIFGIDPRHRASIDNTMLQMEKNLVAAAQASLGYAAVRRFCEVRDPLLLPLAVSSLEKALASGVERVYSYALIEAYILTRNFTDAIKLMKAHFAGTENDILNKIALSTHVWLAMNPGEVIPQEIFDYFNTEFKTAVQRGLPNKELEHYIIDYAIYLNEYAIGSKDPAREAEARGLLNLFITEQNKNSPSYYHAHYALALSEYAAKNYDQVKKYLEPILGAQQVPYAIFSEELQIKTPLRANAFNLRVQVYRSIVKKNGMSRKDARRVLRSARKYLDQANNEFPDDPIILNTSAVVFEEIRHYAEAEKYYQKVAEVAPYFLNGYLNHMDLLLKRSELHQEKRTALAEVTEQLHQRVREIGQNARTDLSQIGRITMSQAFDYLVDIYLRHEYEPALAILKTLLSEAEMPANLVGLYQRAFNEAKAELKEDKKMPQALVDLMQAAAERI